MNKLRLQKILFPTAGICTENELYFRKPIKSEGKYIYDETEGCLEVSKRSEVVFDTYFNCFSFKKWSKYTNLQDYYLELSVKGSFLISICSSQNINNKIVSKKHKVKKLMSEKKKTFVIKMPIDVSGSIVYFSIQSLKSGSRFFGGEFYINEDDYTLNNVKLGIAICTYKREEYIDNNIKLLNSEIIENEKSILYNKTHVYISDNGCSLNKTKYESDYIHLYPNINAGGAGGFTRTIIEMIESRSGITHTILMDDDVVINIDSIYRTYMILKLIRNDYKDAFIGGSMLRMDRQNKLVESGAIWNNGLLINNKSGLDLKKKSNILFNEQEEYTEYNAWWFCCFPLNIVKQDNLPLPIFIRGDDVEFGLRNTNALILMNGICVWHEPFENKYSSWINYYMIRNQMIVNSLHYKKEKDSFSNSQNKIARHFLLFLFRRLTRDVIYYRYKDAKLTIRGVDDFFKGIDFLKETDPVKLHKEILQKSNKTEELNNMKIKYKIPNPEEETKENSFIRVIRLALLNGYLLPAFKNKIVSLNNPKPKDFLGAKKVLFYDETNGKGMVLKRSWIKMLSIYFSFCRLVFKYWFRYNSTRRKYNERVSEITSYKFWKNYLGIDMNP